MAVVFQMFEAHVLHSPSTALATLIAAVRELVAEAFSNAVVLNTILDRISQHQVFMLWDC